VVDRDRAQRLHQPRAGLAAELPNLASGRLIIVRTRLREPSADGRKRCPDSGDETAERSWRRTMDRRQAQARCARTVPREATGAALRAVQAAAHAARRMGWRCSRLRPRMHQRLARENRVGMSFIPKRPPSRQADGGRFL
jgi:hypothetical protein